MNPVTVIGTPRAEKRFMDKVSMEALTGCWIWTGARQRAYGKIRVFYRDVRAHRFSWEMHKGPIPEGMDVLHHCDNPLCVNPNHLFIGSQRDNMDDMNRKGRGRHGQHNREKTHCHNGHPLSGENLYVPPSGYGRYCKECRRTNKQNYLNRLRAKTTEN